MNVYLVYEQHDTATGGYHDEYRAIFQSLEAAKKYVEDNYQSTPTAGYWHEWREFYSEPTWYDAEGATGVSHFLKLCHKPDLNAKLSIFRDDPGWFIEVGIEEIALGP